MNQTQVSKAYPADEPQSEHVTVHVVECGAQPLPMQTQEPPLPPPRKRRPSLPPKPSHLALQVKCASPSTDLNTAGIAPKPANEKEEKNKDAKKKNKKKKLGENKVHVQNERTFLSWFSAAMFLFFLGFTLMRDVHTIPLGAMVCIYSSAIVLYALWQYQNRMRAFYINDQNFEYRDKWGPICIVVGLFTTLIIGIILDFVVDGQLDWQL